MTHLAAVFLLLNDVMICKFRLDFNTETHLTISDLLHSCGYYHIAQAVSTDKDLLPSYKRSVAALWSGLLVVFQNSSVHLFENLKTL